MARPPKDVAAGLQKSRLHDASAKSWGLIAQGLTNREIARTLWISESTVKVHVRHVLAKMGARSRTEAIAASADTD